jgi:integrase
MNTGRKKSTRSKRGYGSLYVRSVDKKEYPAGTPNVKGGTYWLSYLNEQNKRRRIKLLDNEGNPINTLKEAKKAQEKFIRLNVLASKEERLLKIKNELEKTQIQKQEIIKDQFPPLMIKDAWDVFISHPSLDIGETLEYSYRGHWRRFVEWMNADDLFLKDITRNNVLDYARNLGSALSPSTYNKHINFLKLFFRTLKDEAQLIDLFFDSIASKKLKVNSKKPLSYDQMILLIDAAEGDLKRLLMIGATTGLRLGDCVTLRWSEVDLSKGLLTRVPNKTSKSKGAPSLIGIPFDLINELSLTPVSERKKYIFEEWASEYNYISESGSHTRRYRVGKIVKRHFESNGIECNREGKNRLITDYGFHSLRHAYVVQQASRGVNPLFIEKQVGHSNPQMTLHYTSIDENTAKQNTLSLTDGVSDAEYVVVEEPKIRQELESMNSKNWEKVRDDILEML